MYVSQRNNKFGIAGDWHGNLPWATSVVERMSIEVDVLFQVGDFGIWPGERGMYYLDRLNEAAHANSLTIFALRGNHDSDYWEHVLGSDHYPRDTVTGGRYVRSNIVLLPRVTDFWMGSGEGRRHFFVAGGAYSIDKSWRVPGESWWPEEELTDAEVDAIEDQKVDILLTHDCSNRTPFNGNLKPDLDSVAHRQRIDKVLAKTSPEMHFHGHMHNRYEWMNMVNGYQWTETYGLDMDGAWHSQGILDTAEMKFEWSQHNGI